MSFTSARREEILKFVSKERSTTVDRLYYYLLDTDFAVSKRTLYKDVQVLEGEQKGIYTQNGNGGGIFAEDGWTYGCPITKKDIWKLESFLKYLPKEKQSELVQIINKVKKLV